MLLADAAHVEERVPLAGADDAAEEVGPAAGGGAQVQPVFVVPQQQVAEVSRGIQVRLALEGASKGKV